MDQAHYAELTSRLLSAARDDPRVVGLVALGSMAQQDDEPDRFSDHDFFLVTIAGAQQSFRDDLAWLPDAPAIALAFQETAHGLKVLYTHGHLLEFAVFDLAELDRARVNRYRVLLDRADVENRMRELGERTAAEVVAQSTSDRVLFGQFLCHLLVGAGRAARGETLSGRHAALDLAPSALVTLVARHVPSAAPGLLDSLDPLRRVERAYPELGRELAALAVLPTVRAAMGLLEIAERGLVAHLGVDVEPAVAAVRAALASMTDG